MLMIQLLADVTGCCKGKKGHSPRCCRERDSNFSGSPYQGEIRLVWPQLQVEDSLYAKDEPL